MLGLPPSQQRALMELRAFAAATGLLAAAVAAAGGAGMPDAAVVAAAGWAMAALRCETAVVRLAPLMSPFVDRVACAARAMMTAAAAGGAAGATPQVSPGHTRKATLHGSVPGLCSPPFGCMVHTEFLLFPTARAITTSSRARCVIQSTSKSG
jgi:hypothetical protein